ncbi:hypothetical protein [Psychroflexus aestuariivivens]|uniref:hypothetical protein n=1 Tax=Psychroflexus aestuariivivens TaxID=1795040 RepID=UPI000FD749CE|nr:hypothetical protein [Psychroflexus aestuariivivens]
MDELDLIKKDWQKRNENLPKFSASELYPMLKKRSSSIVKWIFLISVIEFLFWIGIEIISFSQEYMDLVESMGLGLFLRISMVINYIVIVTFIILFFNNYRKIKINDDIKTLMKNIIRTRKTVKCYVWFNVSIFIITFLVSTIAMLVEQDFQDMQKVLIVGVILIVVMTVFVGLILLFYRLLYGFLTKKLYRNYEQLKRIEL